MKNKMEHAYHVQGNDLQRSQLKMKNSEMKKAKDNAQNLSCCIP
jgi:hypothetical protein